MYLIPKLSFEIFIFVELVAVCPPGCRVVRTVSEDFSGIVDVFISDGFDSLALQVASFRRADRGEDSVMGSIEILFAKSLIRFLGFG